MIILNILVFIFVLGLLVFFHELGHFLAAKACGIYVDRFSLGMPPRIFGIRWGETDYCIGALPIGGYVKMAGQEDVPSSEQEQAHEFAHVPRERWFNTKPVWQRMIVIIAGPLMNIVLALLLYALVTIVGADVPASDLDSRIGFVAENSVAESALMFRIEDGKPVDFSREPDAVGWETGDRIVSIDGSRIRNMRDVMFNAILGGTEVRDVLIERPAPDTGEPIQFISRVAPRPLTDRDPYPRFGTTAFNAALIDAVQPGSPAEAAGLKPGDIIERANGRRVDAQSFTSMVLKMNDGQTLELDVKRGQEQIALQFQPRKIGRIVGIETSPTLIAQFSDPADEAAAESTPLEIVQVTEEFHKETGLRPGDQIVEVDGQPATAKLLRDFQSEIGRQISAKVHRPAVLMGLARSAEDIDVTFRVESIGWVGVRFREQTVLYKLPVRQALVESFTLCKQDIERTILTLVSLFSGTVSANELGGPILIYQLTTTAAGIGLATLLKMTAFISVNLCIINLLPIPVADGGHMVFLTLEAIRRKPLDIRIMERIQQAGLVLLLLIFLFVTFNDLNRLLFGWMR